jgi:hypothetical protein
VELTLDRAACLATFEKQGPAGFRATLDTICYLGIGRKLDLYSMSGEWTFIPRVKIIKCRGARGDLIVHLT